MNAPVTFSFRAAAAAAALALCLGLAACKTPLDRAYSVAVRAHVAQSIANPEAGIHDLEARRPDGITTDAALNKYRSKEAQLSKPEEPPIININAR